MLTDQLNLMSSWNSSLQDRGMAEMYTMKLSKYVRGSEWYIVCNCSEKFAIIANVTIQFTLPLPFLSDSQGRNSEILFWLMGVKKTFNKCWIVICGISCFSLPFLWLDLLLLFPLGFQDVWHRWATFMKINYSTFNFFFRFLGHCMNYTLNTLWAINGTTL